MKLMRLKFAFEPILGGVWGRDPQSDANDIVCVRAADFDDDLGLVTTDKLTLRNISRSEQNGRLLRRGDLLLEKSGGGEQTPVGRAVRFDHNFVAVCSNFIGLLRPKSTHDPRYLAYLMRRLYQGGASIPHTKQTTGIQNLDCCSYLSQHFDFPDNAGQQRIATYLDSATTKIDRLMSLRRRQMELLREQRTALLQQAVTCGLTLRVPLKDSGVPWLGEIPKHWEVVRLGRLARLQGGYAFDPKDFADEGVPVVRMNNLKRGELDLSAPAKISPTQTVARFALCEGDILFGMSGSVGETGSLGNFAFVTAKSLPLQLNQRVGRFVIHNNKLSPDFLRLVVQSKLLAEQILLLVTGSAQFNISSAQVESITIAIPPIEEQAEIFCTYQKKSTKLDELHRSYERQLALLAEYRDALIHECVTGQRPAPN